MYHINVKLLSSIIINITMVVMMSNLSSQTSTDDYLTITLKEKKTLDKFKELVQSRLPHNYMHKEIYLIRWLRAKRFDISAAENSLIEHLKWRKENDIDNILNEDWSRFEDNFRFDVQGCDKEGRPVVSIPAGSWDVRRAVISESIQRTIRYFYTFFEHVDTKLRQAQEDGENMTQCRIILDMSGYNLVLQGCPSCVPVYIQFFQAYEAHYPGLMHSTIIVNVPQIGLALWQIVAEFLTPSTRAMIKLYGSNKKRWKNALLKEIDPSNLQTEYGGFNQEGLSLAEIEEIGPPFKCLRFREFITEKNNEAPWA